MRQARHGGFLLSSKDVQKDILIPRYYDPDLRRAIRDLADRFELVELGQLVKDGHIQHSHGDYVPKIHYGTGPYPYVRTSDLANWEIKASPKHGVPKDVYDDYASDQNVTPGDIFFVQEGTYLVGTVAMVTECDGPLLYQHHLAKFKVLDTCPFNAYYLLAAFESPLVHQQVRSKQFSADIIDSVVGRLEEVVVPYPKDKALLAEIERSVESAVVGRARLRRALTDSCDQLDAWLGGNLSGTVAQALASPVSEEERSTAFLGGRRGFSSSMLKASSLKNDVLLPRYYDPFIEEMAPSYLGKCEVVSISELVAQGLVSLDTGDEIGRLNYGTGPVPFVRTSDFGSWELKREAKQGVSTDVYEEWSKDQDIKANDILLVRDGTYLVGTSIMVFDSDLPLLYCGGIYRIRSLDPDRLPPGLLFALLNTPFVRRQIRNKQFTRDVIDTIGQRLSEVLLPIPKSTTDLSAAGEHFTLALQQRSQYKAELARISRTLFAS